MEKIIFILSPFFFSSWLWASPHPSSVVDRDISENCKAVLTKARQMTNEEIEYDPSYYQISYPGGDVAANVGVCTDIIVRSLRTIGMDLQELVHNDMKSHFSLYPKKYGGKKADSNIDHRRVWNLMMYFSRFEQVLAKSENGADYKPCEIIAWNLGDGLVHIGILSDKIANGHPTVIHHIGGTPSEDNVLFMWDIIGRYSVVD